MKTLLAAWLALVAAASANASCRQPESQFEAKDCQYREWRQAEAAMQAQYRHTLSSVGERAEDAAAGDSARAALRKAQTAWANYRNQDCAVEAAIDGATANAGQNDLACRIDHARRQTRRLKALAGQ